MTPWPPTPQPPAILAHLDRSVAPVHDFAATCRAIAETYRQMAQDAYDVGDQGGGDHLTARGLAWELAADAGVLPGVQP